MKKLISKFERKDVVDYCFDTGWDYQIDNDFPYIFNLTNSDYSEIRNTFSFQMWKLKKELKKAFYEIFRK